MPKPLTVLALTLLAWSSARAQEWRELDAFAPRTLVAAAYDDARSCLVLFGGSTNASQTNRETWEWDGRTFARRRPSTRPPARQAAGMAYDSGRRRIVMYGGWPALNDTWEYDGRDWQKRTPANSPPSASTATLVYDPNLGQTLYPTLNVTWAWDGTDWRSIPTSRLPGGTSALTYDAASGRVVGLFGDPASLWQWDGADWAPIANATLPVSGSNETLTADPARGRLIAVLSDTSGRIDLFEWDGVRWSQPTPFGAQPSQVFPTVLAHDPARAETTLLAGKIFPTTTAEVWAWDGSSWRRPVAPRAGPDPAFDPWVGYDSVRGRLLRFGMTSTGGGDRLWALTGLDWQPLPAAPPSPSRTDPSLAYDAGRDRVVLFGGRAGSPLGDTWEFDGTRWAQATTSGPSPRADARLAYHAGRNTVMMWGGTSATRVETDLWEWDGNTWRAVPTATTPPFAFRGAGLAYDSIRDRLVLVVDPISNPETYEWDGTDWIAAAPPPVGVQDFRMAFDPGLGAVVLASPGAAYAYDGRWRSLVTGGFPSRRPIPSLAYHPGLGGVVVHGGGGGQFLSDTHVLTSTPQTVATVAPGCAGVAGTPTLVPWGVPTAGHSGFALEVYDARALSAGVLLLGAGGPARPIGPCGLWLNPDDVALLFDVPTTGYRRLPVPLVGPAATPATTLDAQAAFVDPGGAAPPGWSWTPALRLTVGF